MPWPGAKAGWRRGSELLREVWGYHESVLSRTLDTHIGELRRKLEADPSAPRHILTVRKVGYRLVGGEGLRRAGTRAPGWSAGSRTLASLHSASRSHSLRL